jgi:hypothetical protein
VKVADRTFAKKVRGGNNLVLLRYQACWASALSRRAAARDKSEYVASRSTSTASRALCCGIGRNSDVVLYGGGSRNSADSPSYGRRKIRRVEHNFLDRVILNASDVSRVDGVRGGWWWGGGVAAGVGFPSWHDQIGVR